jgi:hypothetical protein
MTSGGAANNSGEDGRRQEGADACLAAPLLYPVDLCRRRSLSRGEGGMGGEERRDKGEGERTLMLTEL